MFMAQGQIRKGFFFYFGLFALLLIAVFMICLVVMMFNPGKTVLWMQYFTGNEKTWIEKTTDTGATIDWGTVGKVEINCSYADVKIQRNQDYNTNGLYIINNAKGYVAASDAVQFEYDVYWEGNTLKVDVSEPHGFLFLSKDIKIILNTVSGSSVTFSNMNLTVNTTEGDVYLGHLVSVPSDVTLKSFSASTESGNIYIGENINTSNLTGLSLKTTSGKITSLKTVGSTTGIALGCSASLETDKGRIDFGTINVGSNDLSITNKKGIVKVSDTIVANEVKVACVQGNYSFGTVNANLNYSNSEDSMLSPIIYVDKVNGDFTVVAQNTFNGVAEPTINIKEVTGKLTVIANKGSLNVKEVGGAVNVESYDNLGVNINIGASNSNDKMIINTNGDITIGYLGQVAGKNVIKNNKGKITIKVTNTASFTSTATLNDATSEEATLVSDDKISVNLGMSDGHTKNPLAVTGTSGSSGTIAISTNSSISYELVSADSLASDVDETDVAE